MRARIYTLEIRCSDCGKLMGFRPYGGAPFSDDQYCSECVDKPDPEEAEAP